MTKEEKRRMNDRKKFFLVICNRIFDATTNINTK